MFTTMVTIIEMTTEFLLLYYTGTAIVTIIKMTAILLLRYYTFYCNSDHH